MADSGRDSLPLPDYDQLPIGGLESLVRSLSAQDVEELLAYERTHADRVPVTEVLTARLEQLEAGAEPTSGDPGALRPEQIAHMRRLPGVARDLAEALQPAAARHTGPAGQAEG